MLEVFFFFPKNFLSWVFFIVLLSWLFLLGGLNHLIQQYLSCLLCFHRENKNRYLFAYLKSLVDCGIFEHIYLNFLPVGHTHCDIDQLFSRVATFLKGMICTDCCGPKHNLRRT